MSWWNPFRRGWQDADPKTRQEAIAALADEQSLTILIQQDPVDAVRRAAILRTHALWGPSALLRIASASSEERVIRAILAELSPEQKWQAAERATGSCAALLAGQLDAEGLQSQKARVACYAADPRLAYQAALHLTEGADLLTVSLFGLFPEVRDAAGSRLDLGWGIGQRAAMLASLADQLYDAWLTEDIRGRQLLDPKPWEMPTGRFAEVESHLMRRQGREAAGVSATVLAQLLRVLEVAIELAKGGAAADALRVFGPWAMELGERLENTPGGYSINHRSKGQCASLQKQLLDVVMERQEQMSGAAEPLDSTRCDLCSGGFRQPTGHAFWSDAEIGGVRLGNALLCDPCASRAMETSRWHEYRRQPLEASGAEDRALVQEVVLHGIVRAIERHDLQEAQAIRRARWYALRFWQNRQEAAEDAWDFWKA